jgi:8-oxo-dGTP pyrophosphatase MutT (NUDIX family)
MAEANQAPVAALHRELSEELDVRRPIGVLLRVDWVSPHGPRDDLLAFVFDGGGLTSGDLATLRLTDLELAGLRLCALAEAEQHAPLGLTPPRLVEFYRRVLRRCRRSCRNAVDASGR